MGEFKGTPGLVDSNEIEANARAISAVPEMIEALKKCDQYIWLCIKDGREIHNLPEETIKVAENDRKSVRDALAKALGEQSE